MIITKTVCYISRRFLENFCSVDTTLRKQAPGCKTIVLIKHLYKTLWVIFNEEFLDIMDDIYVRFACQITELWKYWLT